MQQLGLHLQGLPCLVIATFTASLSSKFVTLLVAVGPEVGSDCGVREGPLGNSSTCAGVVEPFLAACACWAGVIEPAGGMLAWGWFDSSMVMSSPCSLMV